MSVSVGDWESDVDETGSSLSIGRVIVVNSGSVQGEYPIVAPTVAFL